MTFKEQQDELVLRDTPGCVWLLGLIFVALGGLFVYGVLGGFNNINELSPMKKGITAFIALSGLAGGLWTIARHPIITTILHQQTRVIEIRRAGLTGKSAEVYTFAQAREFRVIDSKDSDGDPIYEIVLSLNGGREVTLSNSIGRDRPAYEEITARLNRFLAQ
jgi:hypothetical protein